MSFLAFCMCMEMMHGKLGLVNEKLMFLLAGAERDAQLFMVPCSVVGSIFKALVLRVL